MKKIHSIVGIETTITPPITKAMTMYELDLVGRVVEHEALIMDNQRRHWENEVLWKL